MLSSNQLFEKIFKLLKAYTPYYRYVRAFLKVLLNPLDTFHVARHDPQVDIEKNKQLLSKIASFPQYDFVKLSDAVGFNEFDQRVSWHWIIIPALIELLSNGQREGLRILEIGTFDARFTRMLADNFDCEIHTVDLPDDADSFINSYEREDSSKRKKFLEARNKRLNHASVIFHQFDSIHMIRKFSPESFDLIWVDGDHLAPHVSFDLLSSVFLCKPSGFVCCDDVMTYRFKDRYVSNESFESLLALQAKGLIDLTLFLKRCKKSNALAARTKFISVSRKLGNASS